MDYINVISPYSYSCWSFKILKCLSKRLVPYYLSVTLHTVCSFRLKSLITTLTDLKYTGSCSEMMQLCQTSSLNNVVLKALKPESL